jgi:hypothetical protein
MNVGQHLSASSICLFQTIYFDTSYVMMAYASAVPILFGRVYLVYEKPNLRYGFRRAFEPTYFCYNNGQLLFLPNDNQTRLPFNNNTCRLY